METPPLTIGQAAAAFSLRASTLRWWEREGLLQPLSGPGGRRRYGQDELRRIALIHLFRQVGLMSLDDVRRILSGRIQARDWRATVATRITAIERQRAQLDSARRYLSHLLICEHDDLTRCDLMDRDLAAHTPWPGDRDETEGDETKGDRGPAIEQQVTCAACGVPVARSATGRPRRYCSHGCRQRAYRRRPG